MHKGNAEATKEHEKSEEQAANADQIGQEPASVDKCATNLSGSLFNLVPCDARWSLFWPRGQEKSAIRDPQRTTSEISTVLLGGNPEIE